MKVKMFFLLENQCFYNVYDRNYGDRCSETAGTKLWNDLPVYLRQTDINLEQFKQLLKTFFSSAEIVPHCN